MIRELGRFSLNLTVVNDARQRVGAGLRPFTNVVLLVGSGRPAQCTCRGPDRTAQFHPNGSKRGSAAAMRTSHQLHLGAFMRPVGIHTAWWRYPGAYPDANFNLQHLIRFAQTLERGRFDAWFMADHLAVLNMPMAALMRSATVTSFDPL